VYRSRDDNKRIDGNYQVAMAIVRTVLFFYFLKIIGFIVLSIRRSGFDNNADASKERTGTLSVDIILPMYNEEKVIVKTVKSLLKIAYNNFRIIIIDDGSTDRSLESVNSCFQGHPKVKVFTQVNSGKSFALNKGINISQSDIVVCIDADTLVRPDVVDKILPYFSDETVAAVSGYLKVGNRGNLLTNVQYVEYITNENFERKVFERFNAIPIIPGAVGAFRRCVVTSVGGYTHDVLTEDSDMTLKILSRNFVIRNAPDVIGFTEAPENLKMFLRQRVRWKVGLVQVLAKYHRNLWGHPNKLLTYLIIPYKWVYSVVLPLVIPFIDYIFICDIIFLRRYSILPYYIVFILADSFICAVPLVQKKEQAFIPFLVIQRLLLRSLTLMSYLHILFDLLGGNLLEWKKILRYGSAKID
jgi:cellulose synthase/poly-beta-1,6-N-acetylglucosamine synthase-like glycosyltransferase